MLIFYLSKYKLHITSLWSIIHHANRVLLLKLRYGKQAIFDFYTSHRKCRRLVFVHVVHWEKQLMTHKL